MSRRRRPERFRRRSRFGCEDQRAFGRRSRMLRRGLAEEEFRGRPVIGIVTAGPPLALPRACRPLGEAGEAQRVPGGRRPARTAGARRHRALHDAVGRIALPLRPDRADAARRLAKRSAWFRRLQMPCRTSRRTHHVRAAEGQGDGDRPVLRRLHEGRHRHDGDAGGRGDGAVAPPRPGRSGGRERRAVRARGRRDDTRARRLPPVCPGGLPVRQHCEAIGGHRAPRPGARRDRPGAGFCAVSPPVPPRVQVSSATGFRSRPTPSISTSTVSPGFSHKGGVRLAPTPPGVPVAITSPGSSRVKVEQ